MSSDTVAYLQPAGAITPTGTWSVAAKAGDFLYIAGMRGIDPNTNKLVEGDENRIRQAFQNMKHIADSEGVTLADTVRLVVYVKDMIKLRPIVNSVQEEFWPDGNFPPRTILEVNALNENDIFEVEGTFFAPNAQSK